MAPAASQSYGRTAGENRRPWGGRQINDKRTERRQEGEGEIHGKIDCKHGARGNLGGGREEGTMAISGREKYHPNFNRTDPSDWVAAFFGLEPNTTQ